MVAGDIVNTASRLQSVAPPGVVLVGESTQRASSAAIAYEAAGEQLLKGKQAPVAAWRALRVVARVGGEGRAVGLEPPFVGRDEELRLLKDQLHAAEREGKLRVVAVTAQAGLGKSRLVWELEKYLDGLAGPELYYWHQGRSPSYGEGVTFWALGEMVRRRARIAEGEDEAATREKLRATLAEFVPDDDERRWLEPALGALLGIDEADWAAREQLFSAWRTFFERVADKGPTVMVFEDLQWADSGLLDFLDHLLDWTRDKPMLIVTLARPEILERRPSFGLGHRAFISIHLEPLADDAMEALLRGLVPALAETELRHVVDRAEGVPLYAVETVRALVDGGHLVREGDVYQLRGDLPTLDIPPTLRALIASRLDALEAADRGLLQDASVLGQVFAAPALAALSNRPADEILARLRVLTAKELIALENDPRSPERGQYRFTQGVIREVSHGTLSKRDRLSRHLAAARYFETLGDDELAAVLANHYLEAYQAVPEGEEGAAIAAQARVALRGAAERASRLHSHGQALAYLEQALAVTFDEEDRTETRLQAGRAASAIGALDKAEEHSRAAIEWLRAHGQTLRAAEATAMWTTVLLLGSRIDDAIEQIRITLDELGSETNATAVRLNGDLARAHMFRDEPDLALPAISRALEGAETMNLREPAIGLLITKSWVLGALKRQREATALLLGATSLADNEGDVGARTRARFNLSSYMATEDPHAGVRIALEGIALAEQYGLALVAANMAGNAAHQALQIGDLDLVDRLEAGVANLNTPMSVGVRGYAAMTAAIRGDAEGAARRMSLVHAALAGTSSAQDVSAADYQAAWIAFAFGRLDEAGKLARKSRDGYLSGDGPLAAVAAAHASLLTGDRAELESDLAWLAANRGFGAWLERWLHTFEAGRLALDGRHDEARAAYRKVIEEWRGLDLRLDLALALFERARLLGAADEEAQADRDEAALIIEKMGAAGLLERIEAGAGPVVRRPAVTADEAAAPRSAPAVPNR
jgi:tetratricopeptide (TPR) repeat protein